MGGVKQRVWSWSEFPCDIIESIMAKVDIGVWLEQGLIPTGSDNALRD
jgi:hypothetical protein